MGVRPDIVVTIAAAAAVLALLAAAACIVAVTWLVRRERRGGVQYGDGGGASGSQLPPADLGYWAYPLPIASPQPVPTLVAQPPIVQYVPQHAPQFAPQQARPPQSTVIVQQRPPAGSVVLSRPWPGIVEALEQQLRHETDPVDRIRMAVDLGGIGNARSTQAVIAAVRDGIISPAAGAHAVSDSSFDAGVAAGAAIADPDPRVRTFAGLVSQRLERTIHQ